MLPSSEAATNSGLFPLGQSQRGLGQLCLSGGPRKKHYFHSLGGILHFYLRKENFANAPRDGLFCDIIRPKCIRWRSLNDFDISLAGNYGFGIPHEGRLMLEIVRSVLLVEGRRVRCIISLILYRSSAKIKCHYAFWMGKCYSTETIEEIRNDNM